MDSQKTSTILEATDIKKSFKVGDRLIPVLKGMTLSINNGDFLVIVGPSGSGKSTLLHTLLGLEPPTEGTLKFLNFDLYKLNQDDRAEFRKKHIGLIYQQSYWVKALSVLENVAFPLYLNGVDQDEAKQQALKQLEGVGMADWANYVPTELSSGQQQKVGLARSLVTNPLVIIADEPTGNLDTKSGEVLMNTLRDLNQNQGKTILMVTHDVEYVQYATKAIEIVDGLINVYAKKGGKEWDYFTNKKGKGKHQGVGVFSKNEATKEDSIEPKSKQNTTQSTKQPTNTNTNEQKSTKSKGAKFGFKKVKNILSKK